MTTKPAPVTRAMPFVDQPCRCVGDHRPLPNMVELHHLHPQGDQRRLWGEIRDREVVPLCPTGHHNVHAYLDYLYARVADLPGPPRPTAGYYQIRLAREGLRRMLVARGQAVRGEEAE